MSRWVGVPIGESRRSYAGQFSRAVESPHEALKFDTPGEARGYVRAIKDYASIIAEGDGARPLYRWLTDIDVEEVE